LVFRCEMAIRRREADPAGISEWFAVICVRSGRKAHYLVRA
jgi:hypothetical protein